MQNLDHNRFKIIFFVATILLIVLSILFYLRINKLAHANEVVVHATKVKHSFESSLTLYTELESTHRGYFLSNDSIYKHYFFNSITLLKSNLDELDSLTEENAELHQSAKALRVLINKKVEFLSSALLNKESRTKSQVQWSVDKQISDEVKRLIFLKEQNLNNLIRQNSTNLNIKDLINPLYTVFLILGSIIILVAVYLKIMKELHESGRLRKDLEQSKIELLQVNQTLVDKNEEKEKRAAELILANRELAFQNEEKGNRAAELILANRELAFQNEEKGKRAAELILANRELAFHNEEKGNRAAELILANRELAFQNEEKEKRAAALILANKELAFQNEEKEKRAAELILANRELAFQNEEKEKRAAELILANRELAFQNEEKENRAAELILTNKDLAIQNQEIEKRTAELIFANKELESFTYISSHDLQEPLRQIQTFASRINVNEKDLSEKNRDYFVRIQHAAHRMQTLIADLLAYSRISTDERKFEKVDFREIVENVISEFQEIIDDKKAVIEVCEACETHVIPFQISQMLHNLLGNALKFSKPDSPPHITIYCKTLKGHAIPDATYHSEKEYYQVHVSDNGIGFDPQYKSVIFEVFKRLHDKQKIPGTGIGLAIVKKIVENHNGIIMTTSELGQGSSFDIYIPIPN